MRLEFERNRERYELLKWGQQAFETFKVVPPGVGIVHQVNLELLARGVFAVPDGGGRVAYFDSLVGTDSHTTMINGLGIVGWGVGGIEAEAAMLGQPLYMPLPEVVGVRVRGTLAPGATATDLALAVTQMLRAHGVVNTFVEFFGPGLAAITLPDRATIANMAPEYGATMGFFPLDAESLRYLAASGRSPEQVDLVERVARAQGLFRTDLTPDPEFTTVLELDLGTIEPLLAPLRDEWCRDLRLVARRDRHRGGTRLDRRPRPAGGTPMVGFSEATHDATMAGRSPTLAPEPGSRNRAVTGDGRTPRAACPPPGRDGALLTTARRRRGSLVRQARLPRLALALAPAAAVLGACLAAIVLSPHPPSLSPPPRPAVSYTDRHGGLLRLHPDRDGVRRLPTDPDRVGPHLVHAVLAAEDRRFFRHPGVDPLALARAAWQNARARRVVSGGSTLTMQLARLVDPRPRTLAAKLAQVALAVRLEWAHDKRDILAAYLSRAPMGNRLEGFEAAARVYLGKPAAQLSPAEAALLAAVPRAPSRDNPWRDLAALAARRNAILGRMHAAGWLDAVSLAASQSEPVVLAADPLRFAAPHFLARVEAEIGPLPPAAARVVTTLDPALQSRVERIVVRHLGELATAGVRSMAVVVADLDRGEWLAWEGSGGFWSAPDGQLDGARALRQPGSALKPFTYAAAFDAGLSPATVLADIPTSFTWAGGTWSPRNYDQRFHGPLTARAALACSVNVPAARALQHVGPQALLDLLRRAGVSTLGDSAERWGLGLTLGAGEVRLSELAAAFGALLRGGEFVRPVAWRAVTDAAGRPLRRPDRPAPARVCSPEAATQVVDILADPEARAPAFGLWSVLRLPFAAAVKTGTSEGFRDNWCVGGTRDVVVGVWAGNFDRSPMGNVSGIAGAGAVWREVMLAWAELERPGVDLSTRDTLGARPASLREVEVCALSGLEPSPNCPRVVHELLRGEQVPQRRCDWHARAADGRAVVRWPALYRDWAASEGLLAPDTLLADSTPSRREDILAVLAPADGDAFVLSPDLPRRFQSLELRCAVPGAAAAVTWLVDGVPLARVGPPYATRWELAPGRHRFEVAAGKARSHPVVVSVFGR